MFGEGVGREGVPVKKGHIFIFKPQQVGLGQNVTWIRVSGVEWRWCLDSVPDWSRTCASHSEGKRFPFFGGPKWGLYQAARIARPCSSVSKCANIVGRETHRKGAMQIIPTCMSVAMLWGGSEFICMLAEWVCN